MARSCARATSSAATAAAVRCASCSVSGSPASPPRVEWLLGEMEVTAPLEDRWPPWWPRSARPIEGFGVGPVGDGVYRVVVPAEAVAEDHAVPPTLEEVKQQLRVFAGTDFGVHTALALPLR